VRERERERVSEIYPQIACERVIGSETEKETVNFTDFVENQQNCHTFTSFAAVEN